MQECKYKQRISVHLDSATRRELRIQAAMRNTTVQSLTEKWIRDGLAGLKSREKNLEESGEQK